jgi:hypothetical protein
MNPIAAFVDEGRTFSPLFTQRNGGTCHYRIHPMAHERDGVKK